MLDLYFAVFVSLVDVWVKKHDGVLLFQTIEDRAQALEEAEYFLDEIEVDIKRKWKGTTARQRRDDPAYKKAVSRFAAVSRCVNSIKSAPVKFTGKRGGN